MKETNPKKKAGRPKKVADIELSRWTILVPWETRVAATKAAERDKVALNEWISRILNDSARETLKGKRDVAKPDDVLDIVKQMSERIDKLAKDMNQPWWKRMMRKDGNG